MIRPRPNLADIHHLPIVTLDRYEHQNRQILWPKTLTTDGLKAPVHKQQETNA